MRKTLDFAKTPTNSQRKEGGRLVTESCDCCWHFLHQGSPGRAQDVQTVAENTTSLPGDQKFLRIDGTMTYGQPPAGWVQHGHLVEVPSLMYHPPQNLSCSSSGMGGIICKRNTALFRVLIFVCGSSWLSFGITADTLIMTTRPYCCAQPLHRISLHLRHSGLMRG